MSGPKLGIHDFGSQLLQTLDLDPLYVALHRADLPRNQLYRWLVAYWCFYDVGVASYMSERITALSYWNAMMFAGKNETTTPLGGRWPRAAERRHFRGEACMRAIKNMSSLAPEQIVSQIAWCEVGEVLQQHTVMERAQRLPLFGPWISFKVADMLETVLGVPVEFEDNIGLVYKEPRTALDMLAWSDTSALAEDHWYHLHVHFSNVSAPPRHDRPCGVQEVETICCKWKSHMNGHYWVGKDIHEHRRALDPRWGETAQRLLAAYPEEVNRG
jgi:Alpha-glutamyl/putrescinyl thymine pyrophosphorylase clade 2